MPGLPDKGDVHDWLAAGNTVEELEKLAESAPNWRPSVGTQTQPDDTGREPNRQPSQADRLVDLVAAEGVMLFHDDLGAGFARLPVGNHTEIWRCRGKDFRRWLAGMYWGQEEKALGSEALGAAQNVLEARARFEGEEVRLHNRVAQQGNAIWYDLADEDWRAVRITDRGWSIVAKPPILFRRYTHQGPQPEPLHGGDLREFLNLVNLRDPAQQLLLLVYTVCCFVPDIPHPIVVLHGPQGSAKTTLFRMLRRLIDPSAVEVLSFPHSAGELVQQLSHHWAPYYDNVSKISDSVSDVLCRAVTGEGFSKRELYTDDEDLIYTFRRCVGMNGINVAARKPDLLDRCLLFKLEPMDSANRKPENVLWEDFETARPRLLGGILDVLSSAMARRDSVYLPRLPRMADFALWGCAVASALGYPEEEFIAAYEGNSIERNEEALQASPVGAMVVALLEQRPEWEGTATELLAELGELAVQHRVSTRSGLWPQAAHALSRRLNEVRPNLSAAGIDLELGREGHRRVILLRRVPISSVTSVTSDTVSGETPGAVCDGIHGDDASPRLRGGRACPPAHQERSEGEGRCATQEAPGRTG